MEETYWELRGELDRAFDKWCGTRDSNDYVAYTIAKQRFEGNVSQLGTAGTIRINLVLLGQLTIIFLIQAGRNHLLRFFTGKDPAINQMYRQFSGIRSCHSTAS